jgi:hypothetical protein
MNLRCLMIGLSLLVSNPVFAASQTPWFGSEASTAEQINVDTQAQMDSNLSTSQEATLSTDQQCTIEGCRTPSNLATPQ